MHNYIHIYIYLSLYIYILHISIYLSISAFWDRLWEEVVRGPAKEGSFSRGRCAWPYASRQSRCSAFGCFVVFSRMSWLLLFVLLVLFSSFVVFYVMFIVAPWVWTILRRWGVTWCYIVCFAREVYEQTASAVRCDMVLHRVLRARHL